jgi:hypothetical protein
MVDFTKLENIYRMFSPAEELAARKLGENNSSNPDSIIRKLQKILVDTGDGTPSIADIEKQLNNLRTGASGEEVKILNRIVTFYSTNDYRPSNNDVVAPYLYKDVTGEVKDDITFKQIVGGSYLKENIPIPVSVCLSRSAYLSPVAREVDKVEMFLNYMPSTVISRCVPYLEMEFVFDRLNNFPGTLTTPSLLKFLLGPANVNQEGTTATDVMYRGRRVEKEIEGTKREYTSAGMELFTSPQTLINMDQSVNSNRYVPVLDPTRPFASLESVTINVTPTTGIMSYKSAQAVIRLHDRSRLSEFADLVQPTTYGRTTIWLTYGWRHQTGEADKQIETYADYINKKMLIKEAYGITNSSYAFDSSGQVTITLQLFTKTALQLQEITLNDNAEFLKLAKEQAILSNQIDELSKQLGIDLTPKNKEIRMFTVLNAAADNTYPDLDKTKVKAAITELYNAFGRGLRIQLSPDDKKKLDDLKTNLDKYYFGDPNDSESKSQKLFAYKAKIESKAETDAKNKFIELHQGPDPFIIFTNEDANKNKHDKLLQEFGYDGATFPYINEIKSYLNSSVDKTLQQELSRSGITKNKVVSFGKLFTTFVVPAVLSADVCDECQIYFYNINDIAGKASGTNLAEFPIDLPDFMYQYREELKSASAITIEKFLKLVVNAQITDYRAIPYGFRSVNGLFKPWSKETGTSEIADKKNEDFVSLTQGLNGGRGAFQFPQVEIYIEMSYQRPSEDVLVTLRDSNVLTNPYGTSDRKILKIHVYDKSLNPYPEAARILKSETNGVFKYTSNYVELNPFIKTSTGGEPQTQGTTASTTTKTVSGAETREITLEGDYKDREKIRRLVTEMVPTLSPGMNASSIIEATMSTKMDANLAASQMLGLNSGRNVQATPRGSGVGNLPLKVIPAALTMRTLGCPIISYSQLFFVDMNTGTTIDNIYGVTGITHQLQPGKFETSLQFGFYDAYGKYESPSTVADSIYSMTQKLTNQQTSEGQNNQG